MHIPTMTEQELDRLETLLSADCFNDEAMPLDTLQGFLCAAISGPQPLSAEEWMPLVFGEAKYDTQKEWPELSGLLLKFHDRIAAALAEEEDFDLILYGFEDDPEQLDYAPWCDGYVYGSQAAGEDWFETAGEYAQDLSEKMEVFFLLNGMLKEDALASRESWPSAKEEARLLAQAQEDLPAALTDIYRFWRNWRAPVQTVRREAPKTGRNDPCPCGSGKKYKQCCGDKPTLH